MWYVGYMCEGDIIIYFPVYLSDFYEITSFDDYLGKAYGVLYKTNKEVYDKLDVNVGIYQEVEWYDSDDPLSTEYSTPTFSTKEEVEKFINETFDGTNGVAVD